jgi:hypothetical protein
MKKNEVIYAEGGTSDSSGANSENIIRAFR